MTTATPVQPRREAHTTEELNARRARSVSRAVGLFAPSVSVDRGRGAEVWDKDGRRYIDFAGGIGVLNVGHCHPRVVAAVRRQAERLIHVCFSVASYEPYIELCERLADVTPGRSEKKAALFNSGAEAVENAVKMARATTGRTGIVAFENAFHGRTMMAMTLTGKQRPYREGFGPFAPAVHHARFPYAYRCDCPAHTGPAAVRSSELSTQKPRLTTQDSRLTTQDPCPIGSGVDLEQLLDRVGPSHIAAIIVEPVQGEGGFVVAPAEWLRKIREICTREGIVMIVDEVQTGLGRTGTMFASEQAGVEPDLLVLAKSIGAGMPLSAVVGRSEIVDGPGPGGIGGTYGGNPLACAAALAVLGIFEEERLVERAQVIGRVVEARFDGLMRRYAEVGEVRGLGAMRAMELVTSRATKEPASDLTSAILKQCHELGLLIIKAGLYDNVIRFLAPLVITDELLDEGLDVLEQAFQEVVRHSAVL